MQVSSKAAPVVFAVLSATLFGIGTPFAKLLVADIPPVALAGLFYIGAFAGLGVYVILRRLLGSLQDPGARLMRADYKWLVGAIVTGGVIAPICLMLGLTMVSGFSGSLLLNLEGVSTALLAAAFFGERLGKTFAIAIIAMTGAGVMLSWDPGSSEFSLLGPLLLVGAAVGWGLDNNFTRNICARNPVRVAQIRGGAAGSASLLIAFLLADTFHLDSSVFLAIAIGAASYGASMVLFMLALQGLGAARTAAFFSLGPFVGAAVALPLLGDRLGPLMLPAAGLMACGTLLILREQHAHPHRHKRLTHAHLHTHSDELHRHHHQDESHLPHSHEHTHQELTHSHAHWPDVHHRHTHGGGDS